jgi:hypothetical protein
MQEAGIEALSGLSTALAMTVNPSSKALRHRRLQYVRRYYLRQSSRTDIALHMEYNFFQSAKVGTGGGDLHGQTIHTGVDFAF